MDPTIRAQLNKVEVIADPEIEKVFPELQRVAVRIETTDGEAFETSIDYPKGDPRNPLTDAEIESKFDALAEPIMSSDGREKVKELVWNLENLSTITELMASLQVK
jgi:2-methylcitrate dehydratase